MLSIIGLFVLIVVLVILTIFAYKVIYTVKINKIIKDGDIKGRKLVDISKMVMGTVIVGLVFFCGMLIYMIRDYTKHDDSVFRNNYAVIDVSDSNNYQYVFYSGSEVLEDASFAKVYRQDMNYGYNQEVIESGGYVFTVFTRNTPPDSFHPDFLCFAEYKGENREDYICYSKAGFESLSEETGSFYAESSGNISDCLLYIGYLDKDSRFSISMNLLDPDAEMEYQNAMGKAYADDKGNFPTAKDYAVSTGSVSIAID